MFIVIILLGALPSQQSPGNPAISSPKTSAVDLTALQSKAESGDGEAQFQMGQAFESGVSVKQNDAEAAKWYRMAAEHGNAAAQVQLGILLWTGRGVDKDKTEAVTWYRKAAKQGNSAAMFNLGTAYYNGEGLSTDNLRALEWFLLAQNHGSTLANDAVTRFHVNAKPNEFNQAYIRIAEMCVEGKELNQDYVEAAKWYHKAAEEGDASAAAKLGLILAGAGAFDRALPWCQTAATKGDREGMFCMGWLYQGGTGVEQDPVAARQLFERAASYGDLKSCLKLGQMYWDGEGVKADKVTAYKWALVALKIQPKATSEADRFRAEMTEQEIRQAEDDAKKYLKRVLPW